MLTESLASTGELKNEPTGHIHKHKGRDDLVFLDDIPVLDRAARFTACLGRVLFEYCHVEFTRAWFSGGPIGPLMVEIHEVVDRVHHVQLQIHQDLEVAK